jgi:outer membrane PBP1 activator LpoA protein
MNNIIQFQTLKQKADNQDSDNLLERILSDDDYLIKWTSAAADLFNKEGKPKQAKQIISCVLKMKHEQLYKKIFDKLTPNQEEGIDNAGT